MRPGTMGHATGGRKRLDLSPPAGRPSAGGRSRDRHRRRGATVRRGRPPPHHTTPHHNTAAHSSIRLVSATATATVKAVAMMRWRRTVRFFFVGCLSILASLASIHSVERVVRGWGRGRLMNSTHEITPPQTTLH